MVIFENLPYLEQYGKFRKVAIFGTIWQLEIIW